MNAKIGVLVPIQTLTGDSDAPALSWDRSWSLPAGTTRHIVLSPEAEHDWYIAGTTRPSTGAAGAAQTDTTDSDALESDRGGPTTTAPTTATTTAPTSAEPGAEPRTEPATEPGAGRDAGQDPGMSSTYQRPIPEEVPEILTVVRPRRAPKLVTAQYPTANASPVSGHREQSVGPVADPAALQTWIHGADPEAGNLLARAYQSRTSRDRQRDAILIRDGHCTQPGCTNPGWQAEIDHTQSYETGGATTGQNLKVLCRDCHNIKSHQLDRNVGHGNRASPRATKAPARASPTDDEDLPEWLIETRPPPDWAVEDAPQTCQAPPA